MINVEILRAGTENSMAVIRRFTRKLQGAGIVREVRNRRYFERNASSAVSKKSALKRIAKREKFAQLLKEGKVTERAPRRGH